MHHHGGSRSESSELRTSCYFFERRSGWTEYVLPRQLLGTPILANILTFTDGTQPITGGIILPTVADCCYECSKFKPPAPRCGKLTMMMTVTMMIMMTCCLPFS